MTTAPSARIIPIWLTPDRESFMTIKEIAKYLGISYNTLYARLVSFGEDCDLTYTSGNIPKHCLKKAKPRVVEKRPPGFTAVKEVDPVMSRLFVLRLIHRSREEYIKKRCRSCRSFLLNEDGMLYWYLELMYDEDRINKYVKRQREFVEKVDTSKPKAKRHYRASKITEKANL